LAGAALPGAGLVPTVAGGTEASLSGAVLEFLEPPSGLGSPGSATSGGGVGAGMKALGGSGRLVSDSKNRLAGDFDPGGAAIVGFSMGLTATAARIAVQPTTSEARRRPLVLVGRGWSVMRRPKPGCLCEGRYDAGAWLDRLFRSEHSRQCSGYRPIRGGDHGPRVRPWDASCRPPRPPERHSLKDRPGRAASAGVRRACGRSPRSTRAVWRSDRPPTAARR